MTVNRPQYIAYIMTNVTTTAYNHSLYYNLPPRQPTKECVIMDNTWENEYKETRRSRLLAIYNIIDWLDFNKGQPPFFYCQMN